MAMRIFVSENMENMTMCCLLAEDPEENYVHDQRERRGGVRKGRITCAEQSFSRFSTRILRFLITIQSVLVDIELSPWFCAGD